MTTLIFPYVNEESKEYARSARARCEEIICAASEDAHGDEVIHILPSIHETTNFFKDFMNLVTAHNITHVFCPVASVHTFMRSFIRDTNLKIELIGESPIQREIRLHRELMDRTDKLIPLIEKYADGLDYRLNRIEVAGMLKRTSQIYGESNDEKIAAMIAIFASAEKGDVVEIGSLMGRSAFVLLYMADRMYIGNVLTIDPWSKEAGAQKDSPQLLTEMTEEWNHETLKESFYINLLPSRIDDHSHICMPADEAFKFYDRELDIDDDGGPLDGDVEFTGEISVIHIDGNHDYLSVKSDVEKWLTKMVSGGILILDDFEWCHGDGVTRVGNQLLIDRKNDIDIHFVAGKALFIKFK